VFISLFVEKYFLLVRSLFKYILVFKLLLFDRIPGTFAHFLFDLVYKDLIRYILDEMFYAVFDTWFVHGLFIEEAQFIGGCELIR